MAYRTEFTARAERELIESFRWYEQQQKGLGDRFTAEVLSHIDKIGQNPERFPIKYQSYYEASVPIFPYVIIYRFYKRKKFVRIFSVFHTSQNPKRKYRRTP